MASSGALQPDADPPPSSDSMLPDQVTDEELRSREMARVLAAQQSASGASPTTPGGTDRVSVGKLSKANGGTAIKQSQSDFITIDWNWSSELAKQERKKQQELHLRGLPSHLRILYQSYDVMQSWLALAVVGVLTGIVASVVDIGSDWASDLRFGYCHRGFWVNRDVCCKDAVDLMNCPSWVSWGDHFHTGDLGTKELLAYTFYVLFAVLFAAISAQLVKTYAPYAAGSGIPEIKTILGGFAIKRFLGATTLIIKIVTLPFAVGSGMVLGKEGPLIHVACCIGNLSSKLFSKFSFDEAKKRELLSASVSAGVSVAFGAPIGGVLFTLEEASAYFPPKTMWRSMFCAIIAAITLQKINVLRSGKLVMFEVTYHHRWQWFELFPFMVIGALGGLVGVALVKLNTRWCKMRVRYGSWLGHYPVGEVVIVALFTSLVNYTIIYLRGTPERLLSILYSECTKAPDDVYSMLCEHKDAPRILVFLLLSGIVEFLLAVITFGARLPAGIFIPALVIGACLGRSAGLAIYMWQTTVGDVGVFASCMQQTHCITPGIYAIIGAASVLGGVTRMTVSLVVIMFETTGGLEYILPTMVAVILSKWVADAFGRDSIFVEHVFLNGYPYLDYKSDYHFSETAEDLISERGLCCISLHHNTVGSLQQLLATQRYQGFPVVTSQEDMILIGYVSRSVLHAVLQSSLQRDSRVNTNTRCVFAAEHALGQNSPFIDLSPYLDQSPIEIVKTTPMSRVLHSFKALGLRYMLVMQHGQLVGIIKKKDLLEHIELFHRRAVGKGYQR